MDDGKPQRAASRDVTALVATLPLTIATASARHGFPSSPDSSIGRLAHEPWPLRSPWSTCRGCRSAGRAGAAMTRTTAEHPSRLGSRGWSARGARRPRPRGAEHKCCRSSLFRFGGDVRQKSSRSAQGQDRRRSTPVELLPVVDHAGQPRAVTVKTPGGQQRRATVVSRAPPCPHGRTPHPRASRQAHMPVTLATVAS
jgi:hypothetical protein